MLSLVKLKASITGRISPFQMLINCLMSACHVTVHRPKKDSLRRFVCLTTDLFCATAKLEQAHLCPSGLAKRFVLLKRGRDSVPVSSVLMC